jgi:hypothetical protein
VRKTIAFTAFVSVLVVSAAAWTAAQQKQSVVVTTTIEEVLQAFRADLQSGRADIIAKNLTLNSQQADKFWPAFEMYQQAQNVIMDEQMRGIQSYIENFDALDDAGALSLINAHFDRDAKMVELRRKWLADFQQILGTKLAVRMMQIDRRLSLAHQMDFVARIPLAH